MKVIQCWLHAAGRQRAGGWGALHVPQADHVPFLHHSHCTACWEGGKELAIPGGIPSDSDRHLHPDRAGCQVQACPQELRQLPPPAIA